MGRNLLLGLCLGLAACSSPEVGKVEDCRQGDLRPCECDDGQVSVRTCDGSGEFGSCECDSVDPADAGVDATTPDVANAAPSCLAVSPTALNFGDVSLGSSAPAEFAIENCSPTQRLEIESLSVCEVVDGTCEPSSEVSFELPEYPAGIPATLMPGESATVLLTYAPSNPGDFFGTASVVAALGAGDTTEARAGVSLEATTAAEGCRPDIVPIPEAKVSDDTAWVAAIATIPLKTIEFRSAASTGPISTVEWTVVQRPTNSTAQLLPDPAAAAPTLFLDLQGGYNVQLEVFDESGIPSCSPPAFVSISAASDADVMVQVTWDTPTDTDQGDTSGTDVDLHFLHPNGTWNNAPFDIFWNNPTADWGAAGNLDDPSLDIDDTDGSGPESLSFSGPEAGLTYAIGVYYYADAGYGPSYATLRVFEAGTMAYEYRDMFLPGGGTFWYAATLAWPSGMVMGVNNVQQGFPN